MDGLRPETPLIFEIAELKAKLTAAINERDRFIERVRLLELRLLAVMAACDPNNDNKRIAR